MNQFVRTAAASMVCAIGASTAISAGYGQKLTVTPVPTSVLMYPGQKEVPVTIKTASSDYAGPIVLTLNGLPSGVTYTPLTVNSGEPGTLKLSASVAAGQEGFTSDRISTPTSWTATVTVVATAGTAQGTATFPLTLSISNPSFAPEPSAIDLPIVKIDTGGKPIVSKNNSVSGTITITSSDGQTSYLPNASDTDNTASFHVRGNTTALMPKKPYHIKLNTSLDLLKTMGLSCGYLSSKGKPACDKSKSYVLLANWDDKTFLRDWSASALANAIPIGNGYLNSPADSPTPSGSSTLMPWAPHSLFVELWVNGVYEGNYQLIEEVKVDSNRVNINELGETSKGDLTGGYLLEIDFENKEDYLFSTPKGIRIGLVDPDNTPEVPEQTTYITDYVDKAEDALYGGNFTDPTLGWRAYFDEASAVNFYIVNDLMGNVDGGDFFSSDYLYKSQDDPLLYMGPIWDFDISSGNTYYAGVASPTAPWMQIHGWYKQWFTDPGFKSDVITQWNTLKQNGVFSAWLASIQKEAVTLEQSQANNFGRWPMQGLKVWPNLEAAGSYDGEVTYLTDYLQARMAYLDSEFNARAATKSTLSIPSSPVRAGTPVTMTVTVTGGTAPTGGVSFQNGWQMLGIVPLSGGTASLTTTLPAGTYDLRAFYNGDNNNALSISNAASITIVNPLAPTAISVAGPDLTDGSDAHFRFNAAVIGSLGASVPTGSVTFFLGHNAGQQVALSKAGHAALVATAGDLGIHLTPTYTLSVSYAGDANYAASEGSITFKFPPPALAPAFSRAAGTYTGPAKIVIADATPDATIYYTVDGDTPTKSSTKYTSAGIEVSKTETIKAIAAAAGYAQSPVATVTYKIK